MMKLKFRKISIHASTREATMGVAKAFLDLGISIHASTREATSGSGWRVRVEGISIHASTREATIAGEII